MRAHYVNTDFNKEMNIREVAAFSKCFQKVYNGDLIFSLVQELGISRLLLMSTMLHLGACADF